MCWNHVAEQNLLDGLCWHPLPEQSSTTENLLAPVLLLMKPGIPIHLSATRIRFHFWMWIPCYAQSHSRCVVPYITIYNYIELHNDFIDLVNHTWFIENIGMVLSFKDIGRASRMEICTRKWHRFGSNESWDCVWPSSSANSQSHFSICYGRY